jgi:predicted Zn-dependent peptidase
MELNSLKEKFSDGVSYFKELLVDPNFTKESFEKIKLLKMASIEKKKSNFDYQASLALKKLRYKGTPIANPAIGTIDSLNSFTLKDVENFYKTHLVLSRAVVVIGGDLTEDEAKKFATVLLSGLEVGESKPLKTFNSLEESKRVEVIKDTKQAYVYFGAPYHMKVDDKEVYKSKVASFILGSGGFGSRLMEEVRVKRGLAYSAYARTSLNRSHSAFSGHLQTKLESQEEAIELVKEVIANFVKKGATADELEQAKKFIIGSEPLRNETLNQRLNKTFMEYYKGLGIGYGKKELENISKLTLEDLNKFIASHDEINKLSFSIVTKK